MLALSEKLFFNLGESRKNVLMNVLGKISDDTTDDDNDNFLNINVFVVLFNSSPLSKYDQE